MIEKYLKGTLINDPVWVNELASFASTCNKLEMPVEYKKIFRDMFFEYLKRGVKPKEAIEKTNRFFLYLITK